MVLPMNRPFLGRSSFSLGLSEKRAIFCRRTHDLTFSSRGHCIFKQITQYFGKQLAHYYPQLRFLPSQHRHARSSEIFLSFYGYACTLVTLIYHIGEVAFTASAHTWSPKYSGANDQSQALLQLYQFPYEIFLSTSLSATLVQLLKSNISSFLGRLPVLWGGYCFQ